MDIYWIADKKQCGPASVPDVLSLVQMGELTPDTRGWHAGCEKWMPLRELPALADFLQEKPAPEPEEELPPVPGAAETPTEGKDATVPEGAVRVYLPSAAVRLLARLVDMALYVLLVFLVIYVRGIPFNAGLLPSSPLMWIGFVVLEALLVGTLGTTPGKSLMGIRVHCVNGERMTMGRAFSRAGLVFMCGMGMMVSLLPMFMMGYSWWVLRSRGITVWDARCATLPLQMAPVRTLRQFMAVAVLFCCVYTTAFCMQPWLEPMVQLMEQQSPELGRKMRQMMPDTPEPDKK